MYVTLMALHITQILCDIVLEFLLFVFCFCIFFCKGISGHDMPSSSVGSNQLPFTGVIQTYQSSKYNMLFSYSYYIFIGQNSVSCFNLCISKAKTLWIFTTTYLSSLSSCFHGSQLFSRRLLPCRQLDC